MAKGEGMFWVASVEKAAGQIIGAIQNRKQVAYITKRWGIMAALLKILPRRIYQHV
jgi:short-subunit dehydrogenase